VRFDRHAVYLGQPGPAQSCPAQAAGRTEAILVSPLAAHASQAGPAGAGILPATSARSALVHGSAAQLKDGAHGVLVTVTWGQHPAVIERALGRRTLSGLTVTTNEPRSPLATHPVHAAGNLAHTAAATVPAQPIPTQPTPTQPTPAPPIPAQPGAVYTGLGIDTCATPSASQMAAWGVSPYRAVGVYVGGANMACSQSNLTATWVSVESAAGWHIIPIYVGLQSPGNSCGCAAISPSQAASQGAAAATDAVLHAEAVGIGPGNPIYYDMEAYPGTTAQTTTVLAFLAAWTTQLHASGFKSGVYSSADSGISDLAVQYGTAYVEPDDLWIADWNGVANTVEATVPAADWAAHQRLHQYSGSSNATYGGATLNIDGDYLDGATAAAGSATTPAAEIPLTLGVAASANGAIDLYPNWPGVSGIAAWQVLAGPNPAALAATGSQFPANSSGPIVINNAYPYFAVWAIGSAGQTMGGSSILATPAHVSIYGNDVFVPSRGLIGVPVSCFGIAPCAVRTTVTSGRSTLATTGPEYIVAGGGYAFFTLSARERTAIARASHHQIAVNVSITDTSGHSATRPMELVSFATSGASPHSTATASPSVRIIGTADFVSSGWIGAILVACLSSAPCQATTAITVGRQTIARSTPQTVGVGEVGNLFFTLTAAGHQLLMRTNTNQLPVKVQIHAAGQTATAQLTLVAF
jgi:hypothetical protein